MATINLGNIKFNWQGAYNGATAYAVDDVVSYNGSSYICKLASTGNLPTNTTYFDQMSSAGTNGTDLTSILTTQGDLVYRDGSGLQRLGAGTAGQVLQTGGAGANPSWGTVSSDYVKILTTNYTAGASATLDIDNVFSSTYKYYKIELINLIPDNSSAQAFMYFKDSSGVIGNGYYHWQNSTEISSAGNNAGTAHQWNGGGITLSLYGGNPLNSGTSRGGLSSTMTILNPYDNAVSTAMYAHTLSRNWDDSRFVPSMSIVQNYISGSNYSITGFRLTVSSGNISRAQVSVYGIKD